MGFLDFLDKKLDEFNDKLDDLSEKVDKYSEDIDKLAEEYESLIPPAPFCFFRMSLAILGLLCFQTNFKIFCVSSVKNVLGNWIGIALNL